MKNNLEINSELYQVELEKLKQEKESLEDQLLNAAIKFAEQEENDFEAYVKSKEKNKEEVIGSTITKKEVSYSNE